MPDILRWCFALFGSIFLTILTLLLIFYASDGFVGEIWLLVLGPLLYSVIGSVILLAPVFFIDRLLIRTKQTSLVAYCLSGGVLSLLCLVAWSFWDSGPKGDWLKYVDFKGYAAVFGLGALGGGLFRLIKGAAA